MSQMFIYRKCFFAVLVLVLAALSLRYGAAQAVEQDGIQADCTAGWGDALSGDGRYFPDLHAVYWAYRFDASAPYAVNTAFRIHGQFAYARNTSFHFYPTLSENRAFSFLSDINIVPDAGSTNPFLPGANRHATNRWYTIWLVPADSARAGQPNTLVAPVDSSISKLLLRVYRPDSGYSNGGVPLPTIEAFDDDTGEPVNCPLALRAIVSPIDYSSWPTHEPEVSFYHLATSGFYANDENQYLVADLSPNKYSQILVLRFYAPTFLDTYQHPEAVFTGNEEVRFMSLCMGGQTSTKTSECIADDQFTRAQSGYYNVVLGPPNRADIRTAAIARGYNYVGWYSLTPIVVFRQMLPRADFVGSVARVPLFDYTKPMADQRAENFIGIYAPVGRYCSVPSFMNGGTCGMPAP